MIRIVAERICKECKASKSLSAFIGRRSVCRLCWPYISDEKKIDSFAMERTKIRAMLPGGQPSLQAPHQSRA